MSHHKSKRWFVPMRVIWFGSSVIVLLAILVLAIVILPQRQPNLTPEPAQASQIHTVAPTATFTPTSFPSLIPTMTAHPSDTPHPSPTTTKAPTSTPTPTNTPTLPPSPTPSWIATPHTSTPFIRTSPVSGSLSPAPSPTMVYARPVLIEPQEGSSHTGAVTFRWQSVGPLQPGDVYDVRAWRAGEELGVGRTSATELTVRDPSLAQGAGLYRWRVVVIRIVGADPHKDWQIVSPLPDPHTFFWGQPSQPDSGKG